MDDVVLFEEFCSGSKIAKSGLRRSVRGGSVKVALRQFLRAYVSNEWGLSGDAMSYRELTDWLSEGGYETSVDDLKNANRSKSKLVEQAVPHTSDTVAFAYFVKERFPGFQLHLLLSNKRHTPPLTILQQPSINVSS